MTNHRFVPEFFPSLPRLAGVALALSMLAAQGQAQGLKPSSPLRLSSEPTVSRAPAQGGQRQADYIVAVVNSEPITNSEVRLKLIRTEQQILQQGTALPPRSELVVQVLERMTVPEA